jgi:O-acetyl-ADP-ribose deacetylase (regulator of RNase III)
LLTRANPDLKNGGGGVCGRIFEAAGVEELMEACDSIGVCPTGSAVITPGFKLPAKYVIHAVGPVWQGGERGEEPLLRSAYRTSLELATQHNLEMRRLPVAVLGGNFRYPYEQALAVALDEINRYLFQNDMQVTLVMFDQTATALGLNQSGPHDKLHDDHFVEEHRNLIRPRDLMPLRLAPTAKRKKPSREKPGTVHDQDVYYSIQMPPSMAIGDGLVFPEEKTFSEALLKLIDTKGI